MIKVEGLIKRYARNVAVKNISFEVPKGQIVGFLGPNGAGKTTTMRILTCFLPPTAGRAAVAGFDVHEQSMEVRKRVGYLPETPPLYPELSVVDYLKFVGRLKAIPERELAQRVDKSVERCRIGDVRTKLIGKLSKGYRQRVGLAQAIIHNPDVLVLDEPTTGLDPRQIIETRQLIKHLAGDHTIILSTHILPAVEQTCEHVIVIDKGQLVANDSVHNVLSRSRGGDAVLVEVEASDGELDAGAVRGRLEQVPGVSRVVIKETGPRRSSFEVQALKDRSVRFEVAKAVVESGWHIAEMRRAGANLEEVFLELTTSDEKGVDLQ